MIRRIGLAVLMVAASGALSACVVYDERPAYRSPDHHHHYRDRDRDGIPDRRDRDRDGDGVPNRYDRRPDNPYRY